VSSRRARAWATLVVGLAVLALAAWLVRRPLPPDPASPTTAPSATASPTAASETPPETGWVARWTIDGDTLDIERDGVVTRLRLLNIDAPERRTVLHGPQCLAEEARSRLIELAPRGTDLSVRVVGRDRYGRTLGEAWLPDGRMLGAEIVRDGLAAPMTVGGQDTFRAAIDAARDDAAAAGRGLHGTTPSCTIPARVADLESRADGIRVLVAADADALLAELTAADATALVDGLTDGARAALVDRVRAVRATALG